MGRKNSLEKEIEWLIRDKYNGSMCEVAFSCTKNDFSHCRLCRNLSEDIERLNQGEPVDYVISWKEFLGCKVDLSEKPLIPREETEFWVGEAIKEISDEVVRSRISGSLEKRLLSTSKNDFSPLPREAAVRSRISRSQIRLRRPLNVLDLFAGSGCIGLAILKHCPNVQVTFADKEENCVRQIKKNLKINSSLFSPPGLERPPKGLAGVARVVKSDIFEVLRSTTSGTSKSDFSKRLKKFDIIFANPPYIPTKRSGVQKSVKDWEPKQALFAGADGLVIIKKFLKEAKSHLNPGGKIYLEFGYGQKKAIEVLLRQNKYKKWEFRKDQFGRFRLVVVQ